MRGEPDALLLVEFAEDDQAENLRRLERLDELMGDLGHPGSVVKVTDAAVQSAVWEVRAAGLNIMMSMKGDGKPVSFIEDCAVPLEHLADYTERLTEVFDKHGTNGTWYAHASVGCLHVRPVLNLKLEKDAKNMRAIAEEAFAMVREYKGSHSGEHGDGLVRSEFHEKMFGARIGARLRGGEGPLRPGGLMNPGKIVRSAAHGRPRAVPLQARLSRRRVRDRARLVGVSGRRRRIPGRGRDVQQQRRLPQARAGVMCPSYRVTRDEQHVTRGRANTLRLAHHRPARPRRADAVRRDAGDDGAVRLLQGLPARVSDRRRHGEDEDRGAGRAPSSAAASRCATAWSPTCRAMRPRPRACRG